MIRLRIGYSSMGIVKFISLFLYYFISKNLGKVLYWIFYTWCFILMLNVPSSEVTNHKIEFTKELSDTTYTFIKFDGMYRSINIDGETFIKEGDIVYHTTFNPGKIFSIVAIVLLTSIHFIIFIESNGPYLDFEIAQRKSLIGLSRFEIDDDGIYNCVVFGRSWYKFPKSFEVRGKVSSHIVDVFGPTLRGLKYRDRFKSKSSDRENKLSKIGI